MRWIGRNAIMAGEPETQAAWHRKNSRAQNPGKLFSAGWKTAQKNRFLISIRRSPFLEEPRICGSFPADRNIVPGLILLAGGIEQFCRQIGGPGFRIFAEREPSLSAAILKCFKKRELLIDTPAVLLADKCGHLWDILFVQVPNRVADIAGDCRRLLLHLLNMLQ